MDRVRQFAGVGGQPQATGGDDDAPLFETDPNDVIGSPDGASDGVSRALATLTLEAREQLVHAALAGEVIEQRLTDEGVDVGDYEGLTPDNPITESLERYVGQEVAVVAVAEVPNQFAQDRPDASPVSAEFIFQRTDGRFIRALSGNKLALRQSTDFARLLRAFGYITAEVIAVEVKGQANKAYGFGRTSRAIREAGG